MAGKPHPEGSPQCGQTKRNYRTLKVAIWNVRTLIDNWTSGRPGRRTPSLSVVETTRKIWHWHCCLEWNKSSRGRAALVTPFSGKEHIRGRWSNTWSRLRHQEWDSERAGWTPCWDQRTPCDTAVALKNRLASVIRPHAPTLDAEEDIKDHFYSRLPDKVLTALPREDKLILLGD